MKSGFLILKSKILVGLFSVFILATILYNFFPETFRTPLLKLNRTLAGLSNKTISLDKHTIHYLEGGSGPTIILLHGIFSEKDHWVDFARHLTKDYHVIIPDLAGFGDSTRLIGENYGYEYQVKIFEELVKSLKLSTFHLVGNSMGGTIAALYTIDHKDEVKSLAFIGGPHGIKTQMLSEMDIQMDAGRAPLVPETEDEFESMLNMLFHKRPLIPGPILKYSRAKALAQSKDNLRIFQRQSKDRYLLHSKLPEINVPLFVLWGTQEKIFHPNGANIIRDISKTETTIEMIDAGHLPQMEMPAEVASRYMLFLKK